MTEEVKKRKPRTAKSKEIVLPSDQDFRELIFGLTESVKSLSQKIDDSLADPIIASTQSLKDVRVQETKRLFVLSAKICNRNNMPTQNLYPFIVKSIKDFGLCAVDAGVQQADNLCKAGAPQGMIYDAAKKWRDEYGRHDEAYLDALLCERKDFISTSKPLVIRSDENFIKRLIGPYTDRSTKSVSRLEYLNIVKNYCLEDSKTYKPNLVIPYFKKIISNILDPHRSINTREDVPSIDLESLKDYI